MVGLAEFARRLSPDDPDINNTIAYISLVRNNEKALAQAIRKSFQARPRDHALALQWLASEMKGFQDAQSRSVFLDGVTRDSNRTSELRAAAAVHLADILIGQGKREQAVKAFDTAVKLDPDLPAAMEGRLTLAEKVSPADRAAILVGQFIVNPHAVRHAAQFGEILYESGLYEQAARFYDYAWNVNARLGLKRKVSLDFAVQHCNALLSAGQYKRAAEIYGLVSRRYSDSVLLRVLLIEACNNSAQSDRAKMYAREIEAIFAPKRSDAEAAAKLAWLYLITDSDRDMALDYARRAEALKPEAPSVVRAMAVARIRSKKKSIIDVGVENLEKLAGQDVFAAAFLAEHYFHVNRSDDGKKLILSGLALSRSGQAARRLTALAKKYKIAVPPVKGSKELRSLAESVPDSLMEMGLEPEKTLALKVVVPQKIDAGQGVVVQVELSNAGAGKLAVGIGGVIPAAVRIDVAAEGRKSGAFKDVVRLVLPVGRYLPGKGKVTVSGRIDVGEFGSWLAAHPLDDLKLTISPVLVDPGAKTPGGRESPVATLVSTSPGVIARTSVLGKFDQSSPAAWVSTYKRTLSLIMGDLRVNDLEVRLRAARQIASLLVLGDGLASGKLSAPDALTGRIDRQVFAAMAAEVLKNRSDLVRAEMLAELGRVKLDNSIIGGLSSVIRDTSSLVRFRLVELLGASGLPGQDRILQHFAKDKYDLVADLAKAMQSAAKSD